ncbi:MAG: hypothetical protein M3R36_08515 [Bacteroidota bacterium]|nr:hypothetical protein [Bacteroidota bacterium]
MTKKRLYFINIILLFIAISLSQSSDIFSQTEIDDNPRTWTYFKILARAQDDSVFIKLQDELNIDPKLESYILVVNISDPFNQYVIIGDENSPDASRFSWNQLSKNVQQALLNWTGTNKENLNKKKLNYSSVFLDVFKKIKVKDAIAPPARERDILSTTAYINPYFQAFGGDALGIPVKKSVGFSFQFGTPYSGPMETDIVGTAFHILGISVGVTTRIKEFVLTRSTVETTPVDPTQNLANYNNLFSPNIGLEFAYVIPFGNFFEISYFTTVDTGDYDPPVIIINTETKKPMPNNVITGNYTNFEFRYPFRTFGSTRAKLYYGQKFGEMHLGFLGREMRLAGSQFDIRMDATFGSSKRNFQLLLETMISNIGEGFALSSFAIGPSVRLGTTFDNKFGFLTILINMRLKVGDFFEEIPGR